MVPIFTCVLVFFSIDEYVNMDYTDYAAAKGISLRASSWPSPDVGSTSVPEAADGYKPAPPGDCCRSAQSGGD